MSVESLPLAKAKAVATVDTLASLPTAVPEGSIREAADTGTVYIYHAGSWTALGGGGGGSGTVTSVSVVTANGFSGTVATATTTPAITMKTSITGVLKGNATAISAATVGTDYSVGTSALSTGILKSTTATGALSIDATATAFAAYNTNGLITQTAANTFTGRSVAVTASTGLSATNGDGVAGNPTLAGVAMVGDSGSGGTQGMVPAPAAGDAAAGKFLKADGTWFVPPGGGGGSPGGSDTQVQFNDGGSFGGDAGFVYNKTTDTATLGNLVLTNKLPIASGGTNSATTLNNNRVMQSSGGAIVEAAAITASKALVSDANGIPVASSLTGVPLLNSGAETTFTTTGLLAQTSSGALAARTVTGGGGITATNGDGVSGNPTLSISNLRTLWIPAAAMRPSATGGCAALALVASGANLPDMSTLDFDPTTAEYAQFYVRFPKAWANGTITATFYWSHAATTTNFGVVWGLQAVAVGDNVAIGTAYGTAQTVTDTGGTTDNLYISSATSAITVGNTPAAANEVFFRAYRDATAGGDSMTIDARLMGVALFYTVNTLDDT